MSKEEISASHGLWFLLIFESFLPWTFIFTHIWSFLPRKLYSVGTNKREKWMHNWNHFFGQKPKSDSQCFQSLVLGQLSLGEFRKHVFSKRVLDCPFLRCCRGKSSWFPWWWNNSTVIDINTVTDTKRKWSQENHSYPPLGFWCSVYDRKWGTIGQWKPDGV